MSLVHRQAVTCGGWLSILLLAAALRTSFGPSPTVGELGIWLFAFVVPPALVMLLFRGAPPPVMSEVIYRTEIRRRMNEIPSSDGNGR